MQDDAPLTPEEKLEAARDYVLHDVQMALQDYAELPITPEVMVDILAAARKRLDRLALHHKGGYIGLVAQTIIDAPRLKIKPNRNTGRLHADLILSVSPIAESLSELVVKRCIKCGIGYHARPRATKRGLCPRCLVELL